MVDRTGLKVLLAFAMVLPLAGCSNTLVSAVNLSPTAQTLQVGQTVQFTATGTVNHGSHPPTFEDVTNTVTWSSSAPAVATVSASGLATAVSAGTTTITAKMNGFGGVVSSGASITVPGATSAGGASDTSLLSLSIIPSSITVGDLQDTGQYLAIGTFSASPTVRDLTNSVTWISSAPNIFPISTNGTGAPSSGTTAGVITAFGNGSVVVIAEAKDPKTNTIQTATSMFACPLKLPQYDALGNMTDPGSCWRTSSALLATLTIYNAGLNTSNWSVTAPSATGTPNVIHCGPPSTTNPPVCTATYPIGTKVLVTATGSNFGGWSSNCLPTVPVTANGTNVCQVTLTTNDTVGVIFN